MLYFSYAANLNRSHMARLCPGAEPLFKAILENFSLTVRRWFNVELNEGESVYGGVWRISPEHLPSLDSYEDCPGLYLRKVLPVVVIESPVKLRDGESVRRGKAVECLVYVMKKPFAIPLSGSDPEYLEMVREGYGEWGISPEQLDATLEKGSGV